MLTQINYNETMAWRYRPAMDMEIEYGQVDPDARDSAVVSDFSPETPFSSKNQTLGDRNIKPTQKVATLERNSFLLDGSFTLTPESPPIYQAGYRPEQMSDDAGNLNVVYEVNTGSVVINAVGISILFEPLMEEWAVDFDITFGSKLHEIRGNRDIKWVSSFPVTGCSTIRVVIRKWSCPCRRAKIQQFEFGAYLLFDAGRLTRLSVANKLDPISVSLPENIVDFAFQNVNHEYDPMAESGREKFIEDRQPVTVRIGYPGSMMEVGYYETTGSPKITLGEVKLQAASLVKKLNAEMQTAFYQGVSLGQILKDIFVFCGIKKYRIGQQAASMVVTAMVSGDCRGIVTDAAIAARCAVWQESDTLVVDALNWTVSGYYIGSTAMASCDLEFRDAVSKISCCAYTYEVESVASETGSLRVETTGTYMVDVDACMGISVSGGTLVSYGIDYAEVQTTGAADITVSGKKIIEHTQTYEKMQGISGDEYKVDPNQFINTKATAEATMDWLLTNINRRHEFTVEWRQDPAIVTGDIIQIYTDFGNQLVQVEEQNFDMSDGGMKGSTKALRIGKAVTL